MHINHLFLLDFARRHGRALDYGCGAGEVVRAGMLQGLDIYGCETFYEGGPGSKDGAADLVGSRILAMTDDRIPFPDAFFDCVMSNMVFEHVKDLDLTLSEINRVLKPDGTILAMFPSKEVIREGHCGVPLAHRFSRYRIGYYWLLAFRTIGIGYHKGNKKPTEWARDFQTWLNTYCFYRSQKEIRHLCRSHGFELDHREEEIIRRRKLPLFTPYLFRKLGHLVLEGRKLPPESDSR